MMDMITILQTKVLSCFLDSNNAIALCLLCSCFILHVTCLVMMFNFDAHGVSLPVKYESKYYSQILDFGLFACGASKLIIAITKY